MEKKFQNILDTIARAEVSPEDKESLYEVVYNAMVDTVIPILLDHISLEQKAVLDDTMIKPTLNELGEMLGVAMKDNKTERQVDQTLTLLFEEILTLLKEQGIT